MFEKLKRKLGKTSFVTKLVEEPADLGIFRLTPSFRFIIGIGVIGFSYLIAWPFIALLGIISIVVRNPFIVAVGGPIAYGASHIVFFIGVWLAGKDSINYMRVFSRWMMLRICRKLSIVDPEVESTETQP